MSRTLVASDEGVKLARKALKARNLTQTDFATEVGLGYTTVNNFLNSKAIYRTNFQEICVFLDLDWKDIAVFGEEAETQELTPLDKLWQELQLLSSPTEQMGLVLVKEETLGWGQKIPSRYEKSVQVGSYIRFEINLETPGYLLLLQKDTSGQLSCFCPSCFAQEPHLNTGKTTLPQEGSPMTSFPIEGEPGKEEIIAVLTKEVPALDWLQQENDEVLELEASHLIELLKYVTECGDYQLWYTDYMVIAR
jgi:transcriptional regulator with XRE-family HTH domain